MDSAFVGWDAYAGRVIVEGDGEDGAGVGAAAEFVEELAGLGVEYANKSALVSGLVVTWVVDNGYDMSVVDSIEVDMIYMIMIHMIHMIMIQWYTYYMYYTYYM